MQRNWLRQEKRNQCLRIARLLTGEWSRERQNVNLVAPTGLGKSWLACPLVNQACGQGYSGGYLHMPKFNEEMAIAHGSGRYARLLAQWARTDILVLVDLAMAPMSDPARRDLLEVLDDRHGSHSTIVTILILRARARKICNALISFMRSPMVRTPLSSAFSGFPSLHNRCRGERRN
jgi:DNA replication protein DnaC